MTDILTVLPRFDVSNHTHILPSLEKAQLTTPDLLSLDALDVAKRAHVPPADVKKLADALLAALHADLQPPSSHRDADDEQVCCTKPGSHLIKRWLTITTLDDGLDAALGGGIAHGHLTEIVGESAAGKTQFMLTLLLAAQLPSSPVHPPAVGPRSSALYISTEAPLQTTRLAQILQSHPKLANLPPTDRPSLSRIHSTHIHDLEAQEHILRYQVPVAIEKHNVGLLVIDSIAANYRAEFDKGGQGKRGVEALAKRSAQLAKTGSFLRSLAREHDIAVVVANQVADRFTNAEPPTPVANTQSTQNTRQGTPSNTVPGPQDIPLPQSTSTSLLSTDDPLLLDHQQRFFTGWGDDATVTNLKTPSLGLAWTQQLSARIALLKDPIYEDKAYAAGDERNLIGWSRSLKAVFSPWCAETSVPFEIWEGGIRTVKAAEEVDVH